LPVTVPHDFNATAYMDYQRGYRASPRQSDLVLARLLGAACDGEAPLEVLDVGCHNGNLIHFLGSRFPAWRFTGGDIVADVVAQCRADPELSGHAFEVMDVLQLDAAARYDVVVANAVLSRFDDAAYAQAIGGIARVLRPGGVFINFEWYHGFDQTLRIVEETPQHPYGLVINMRSFARVTDVLAAAGLERPAFHPFEIPIDLPLRDPVDALHTHTRTLPDGQRLQFRGAMFQPWCHLVARKVA
jgi:trans-aconitate methyltransferase